MSKIEGFIVFLLGGIVCGLFSWAMMPCLEYWKQFRLEELGGLFFVFFIAPSTGFLSFVFGWFVFKKIDRPWLRLIMALVLGVFISGLVNWVLMGNGDFGYYTKIYTINWLNRLKEAF